MIPMIQITRKCKTGHPKFQIAEISKRNISTDKFTRLLSQSNRHYIEIGRQKLHIYGDIKPTIPILKNTKFNT